VLARGRFDDVKIEAVVRDHGGRVDDYKGTRLFGAPESARRADAGMALAFLEPGLIAVGSMPAIRAAVDLKAEVKASPRMWS